MIEINLLPGSGKKTRSKGAGMNFSELASGFASKVKDPWLLGAVGSAVLASLMVGAMYWHQKSRSASLDEQLLAELSLPVVPVDPVIVARAEVVVLEVARAGIAPGRDRGERHA